jgi:uncharacterized HAD superfamily protein
MKKPLVAIDVDEVLFPFVEHLAQFHNERYGTSLTMDDFSSFKLHQVWGGTVAEEMRKVLEFQATGVITRVAPMPAAMEAIEVLNRHYELAIVTSRTSSIKEETEQWLKLHFPNVFKHIRFANYWDESTPRITKADVCRTIGANILIEDNLDYAFDCAEWGVRVLLFGDYPWNQEAQLPDGVTRVTGWPEVLGELGVE